jgi:hypothetical protein
MQNYESILRSIRLFKIKAPSTTSALVKLTMERVNLISPHLDKFTLQSLDQVDIPSSHQSRRLYDGTTFEVVPKFGSDTHGIFVLDDRAVWDTKLGGRGTMKLWGLTKKGQWISADINFQKNGHATYWSLALSPIKIVSTTIDELIPFWGLSIWTELGQVIETWHEKAAKRHAITSSLIQEVEIGKLFFKCCQ